MGRIGREEISDELHAAMVAESLSAPPDLRKLFTKGEVLCCVALPPASRGSTAVQRGKAAAPPVELSLRLSLVQRAPLEASPRLRGGFLIWATLKSTEEYGYVMETGSAAGGFLSKKSWPHGAHPARWRPHLCAVSASILQQPRKPIQLAAAGALGGAGGSAAAAAAAAPVPRPLPSDTALKFEALQPGMLVDAQVSGVLADGLRLVACGYFEATARLDGLGGGVTSEWAKQFPRGRRVPARILWVDPTTKAIALSLAAHLARCVPYAPPLAVGTAVQTTVEAVDRNGAIVTANGAGGGGAGDDDDDDEEEDGAGAACAGWLGRASIADLKPRQTSEDALKQLRVGGGSAGVVAGVWWLDGLVDVSTRPSARSEPMVGYEDVAVGEVLRGTIARKMDGRGVRIRVARGVYGTCPISHISDKQLQRPLDKLSKGQAVQCLVVECEPQREKLILSLKPALVASALPRVSSYDGLAAGTVTHGVVARLRPKSVVIELLGGVSGIVRGSELKARFGALWESDPTSCYREGQVVECTVLSCAPSERKVLLTLLSEAEAKAKPASKLLQRSSTDGGAEDGAPSSKRQKKGGADEEGAPRLKSSSEAVAGALTTASAVAIGEHGQLLCRLDAKGTMVGRIHMTEQADPGRRRAC